MPNNCCSSFFLTQLYALIVRVEQECAEAVGHVVIGQKLQVILAEFKLHGKLQVDLRCGGPQRQVKDVKTYSRIIFTSAFLVFVWLSIKLLQKIHKIKDMFKVQQTEAKGAHVPTWWTQSRNCRKTGVKPLPWLPRVCAPRWLNLWPNDSHSFSTSNRNPSKVL